MPAPDDVDFNEAMHDLTGMDKSAIEALLDKLDTDGLQDLTDAVAQQDRAAVQQVLHRFNTDEDINTLFRGQHITAQHRKKLRRHTKGVPQFAIGDDVKVNYRDEQNKRHSVSATVAKPDGPEGTNTVVVRIKGKTTVVDKAKVDRLEEAVIGMIGLPNLQRMQQLAGIQGEAQPAGSIAAEPVPVTPSVESAPTADCPIAQVLAAFDTLDAALPNIALSDLKSVRARLLALQTSLNETLIRSDRPRKL